jgi:histidinol-phosphate aminotransferase
MYEVSAKINNVEIVRIRLNNNFELPGVEKIKSEVNSKGLLFICSPNNPTGNVYALSTIKEIAAPFNGLVIVDEAYIDFANTESAISLLEDAPNVVVLQTMSKAYGMAGLRLGMAFANPEIIEVLNKIKPPYNVNTLSQIRGLEAMRNSALVNEQIKEIKTQREILMTALKGIDDVKTVYPTEGNFILAIFKNAEKVFSLLQEKGIIIRNRTSQIEGGLRITVGTPEQNNILLEALKSI